MIIKIMDSNKLFENKDSEISKIFDYINNTLEDKKVFLKSLEIDGIEVYEDYYEYLIENINFIDEVKVNIQNLILVGIGFSMAFSGLMVLLVSSAERSKLEFIAKWLNGNIWGNNWYFVIATLPWLLILLILTFFYIATCQGE